MFSQFQIDIDKGVTQDALKDLLEDLLIVSTNLHSSLSWATIIYKNYVFTTAATLCVRRWAIWCSWNSCGCEGLLGICGFHFINGAQNV